MSDKRGYGPLHGPAYPVRKRKNPSRAGLYRGAAYAVLAAVMFASGGVAAAYILGGVAALVMLESLLAGGNAFRLVLLLGFLGMVVWWAVQALPLLMMGG